MIAYLLVSSLTLFFMVLFLQTMIQRNKAQDECRRLRTKNASLLNDVTRHIECRLLMMSNPCREELYKEPDFSI